MKIRTSRRAGSKHRLEPTSLLPMVLGAGVLVALVLAACSSAPESLEGSSWQMTQIGRQQPVPGTVVTLQFDDSGRVNGTGGCNSYGGPYEVERSNISLGPFATTLMACGGAVGVQETTYLSALEVATNFSVEGDTLTFFSADSDTLVTYTKLSTELAGTSWDVTSYNTGTEAVRSLIIGTEITLTFGADATVSGNASCNDYSGGYELDGDRVTIGPLAVTQKACAEPQGVMEQENQYLIALQNAAVYAINNARIELRDDGGALQVQGNPAG